MSDGIEYAPCDAEIHQHGEVVGVFDMPKAEAERMCKRLTTKTGRKHDWHYVGGRVVVKTLPELYLAKVAAEKELAELKAELKAHLQGKA